MSASPADDDLAPLHSALDFAAAQARRVVETYPGYVPMYTVGGRWHREGELWTHWCEGFYPGIFWLLYDYTKDEDWRRLAEDYSRRLEPRRHDRTVHDLGFLFGSTYLRWYEQTGDPALRQVLIDAGRTLALRRQEGGYLCSFLGPHSLFIDILMNVPLVLLAANWTWDEELRQVALEHCQATARYLVRPDGSTAHEAIFDPATGQFLRQSTQQGWSAESTWSRGLAWALYGFTWIYQMGGEDEYLALARRCADYYLRRAPADLIPFWDFDLPPEAPHLWDSSAAAVAASGLWELGEEIAARGASRPGWGLEDFERQEAEAKPYLDAARAILRRLCSETFLPRDRPDWEGILLHGVYHYPKGLGVDESVAWGDYFFVEALVKVIRLLR